MKQLTPHDELLFVSISIIFIAGLLILAFILMYSDNINKYKK